MKIIKKLFKQRKIRIIALITLVLFLGGMVYSSFKFTNEARATISEVTASGSTSLTSTTYADLDSMVITPGAGNYLAIFNMELLYPSSPAVTNTFYVIITVNETEQSQSERRLSSSDSLPSAVLQIMTH